MKKSFVAFWKDMVEAQKVTNTFVKKHWKGYVLLLTACCSMGYVLPIVITKVTDLIETKKEKSEGESPE